MSESRGLALLTVHNIDRVADIAHRATAFIQENLPGTLAWEYFVDEESGRGLLYQIHAGDDAVRAYEQGMVEQGFQRELGEHAQLDEIIMLSPITSPEARTELDQFGGVAMELVVGVTR